jgi:hypothetical protein
MTSRRLGAVVLFAGSLLLVSVLSLAQFLCERPLPWPGVGYVSQGTGFVVGTSGYVLTNLHVVRDAKAITAHIGDREYSARVVGSLAEHDAALLKVDASGLPAVSLGDSTRLEIGDAVYAVGCPAGVCGTATGGHVANLSVESAFEEGDTIKNLIMLDLTITHGSSGGPLVTEQGQVVGITMGGIEGSGFGFAIPMADLTTLLANSGVFLQAPLDRPLTIGEARNQLMPSVVYIEADRTNPLALPDGYSQPSPPVALEFLPDLHFQSSPCSGYMAALRWSSENLGSLVTGGAEGVASWEAMAGPTVSYECPSFFGTAHYTATVRTSRDTRIVVLEATSESTAHGAFREIASRKPRIYPRLSLSDHPADEEQLLLSRHQQGDVLLERILTLQCGVSSLSSPIASSVPRQEGIQYALAGYTASPAATGDARGAEPWYSLTLCCTHYAEARYSVLATVGRFVIWFEANMSASCDDRSGADMLSFGRSGEAVELRVAGTRSFVAFTLDAFRNAAEAEAVRDLNYILSQLQ